MTLVLQAAVDPCTLGEPLRRAVMEVRSDQPAERILTLEQVLHESLSTEE